MTLCTLIVAGWYLLAPTLTRPAPPPPAEARPHASAQSSPAETPPLKIGPVSLSGYVQFDGLFPGGDHDAASDSTFRVKRARVVASGDFTPRIGWTFTADAAGSPSLRDVYVTFRQLRLAQVRVGQFIAPYSLERITSSKDIEAFDRVVDRYTPGRDMGVMVFSNGPFWRGLSYSAALVNGTGQNARDSNGAKDVVGRLAWKVTQVPGLSIGVNAASGSQPTGTRTRSGIDVNLVRGTCHVAVEYLRQSQGDWQGLRGHGYYVTASRRFSPAVARPDFYMAEAVVRFVGIRDPADTTGGTAGMERREIQAGGNYYFSRNLRVMAYALIPTNRPAGSPRATLATRVQFTF
jgi:hypothetical protein